MLGFLGALLLFAGRLSVQGQFNYITNNGAITITGYTGPGGAVNIPDQINGLPVTSIGDSAFYYCNLTKVRIGSSVTNMGAWAFAYCISLTSVTLGSSVTSIGDDAFAFCSSLTTVTVPNSVIGIGPFAFAVCSNLTSVTIGNGVMTIGPQAFDGDTSLTSAYFAGNAPDGDFIFGVLGIGPPVPATVYYLPGTLGWSNTFADHPTALWFLPQPLILSQGPGFGVQSNRFGFTISWATNVPVVVQAATNLSNPIWIPVATNTLTSGTSYFSDPARTNFPQRFYRLAVP
jgi:hypothetical protein